MTAGTGPEAATERSQVGADLAMIQREAAAMLHDGLSYITGALAVLAAIYAVAHRYLLDPPVPSWVFGGLLAASGIYVVLFLADRADAVPRGWVQPIVLGISFLVTANLVTIGLVRQAPWVSTDFMLLIVSQGLIVLDRRWLAPMVLAALAGWGLVAWTAPADPGWQRFGYWVFSAVFIATVLNIIRQRAVSRNLSAQLRLEEKNAELERLRDEAQAAERAKTALLANTSHEIRTPMNAIIGMTSLLEHEPLPEQAREFVETIRTSGEHLLLVINDILDISKLEADRFELEAIPFRLRPCIDDAVGLTTPKANVKDLEVLVDVDPDVPDAILGDPTRLRQILVNLLSNAIKFTESGHVRLSIHADPRESQPGLRFQVEDTGVGIPDDAQARLFKPFSQVDASTTRRYGGTGLGLSIVHRLVHLMGGKVGVESEVGEGSTFWFWIPAQETAAPEPLPWAVQPSALRGKHILVVDDNEANRLILGRQLSSWTLDPILIETPGEAMERLDENPLPDLVILDYQMPGMDGAELARRIRERFSREELPLIMLSSGALGRTAIEHAGVPLDGFLTKPPRPSILYELILRALSEPDAGEDGDAGPDGHADGSPQGEPLGARNPLSILVAEDSEINQRVLIRMLDHLGYEATCVGDGASAVEAAQEQAFDLVLMDIQMPILDGVEATRRIRAQDGDGSTPHIVALTAHALVGDRERLLNEGMDDYVSKPVDLATLEGLLSRIHRRRQVEDPPRGRHPDDAGT